MMNGKAKRQIRDSFFNKNVKYRRLFPVMINLVDIVFPREANISSDLITTIDRRQYKSST
jgi:hypothetical protein